MHLLISNPFYSDHVALPRNRTPPHIASNPRFYPFFRHCLGAVDGTHFSAYIPAVDSAPYRNRKGYLSQNVFAACSFDERFLCILSGWEGSAADAQVFDDA